MNNYYALFQFKIRPVLVRYISPECIRWDIEDCLMSYLDTVFDGNEEIDDYENVVHAVMKSFNIEYEIVNFDNYFVED